MKRARIIQELVDAARELTITAAPFLVESAELRAALIKTEDALEQESIAFDALSQSKTMCVVKSEREEAKNGDEQNQ